MYYLHRRTSHGTYHLMGDFPTNYVSFAFKDCVNNHTGDYVWITTDEDVPYNFHLVAYDPSVDDFLDVDDWDVDSLLINSSSAGVSS